MLLSLKIALLAFTVALGSFIGGHFFAQFGSPFPRVTNWADVAAGICGIVFMLSLIVLFPALFYWLLVS